MLIFFHEFYVRHTHTTPFPPVLLGRLRAPSHACSTAEVVAVANESALKDAVSSLVTQAVNSDDKLRDVATTGLPHSSNRCTHTHTHTHTHARTHMHTHAHTHTHTHMHTLICRHLPRAT